MENPIQLPVQLHPANLRPIAYRILSKKHGLNIQTESLKILAEYIGYTFGNNWKGSKSQEFLDDLGKLWKEQGRGIFLDAAGVDTVIKELNSIAEARAEKAVSNKENGNPKRLELSDIVNTVTDRAQPEIDIYNDAQGSTEPLEAAKTATLEDEDDFKLHWQDFFQVIPSNKQPRYKFDPLKKQYERETMNLESIKLGNVNSKIGLYQTRLAVIQQRLSRNSNFQQPTYSSMNSLTGSVKSSSVVITPIKNLLGRHGQRFVLFGLLTRNEAGNYSLEDQSDRIELELTQCIATEGSYYCPGFFVIVEGIYSNSGKFYCSTIGHPPAEKREVTLNAYGNIDFLGINSSTNKTNRNLVTSVNGITRINKTLKKNLQLLERELHQHKLIILGHDCNLNDLKHTDGLKKLFNKLNADLEMGSETPISLVFSGSFWDQVFTTSQYYSSTMSSSSVSAEYKQAFDNLASILEKYPLICSRVTLVFIPGDNDPWSSVHTKGSSVMWPQNSIPKVFTNRLSRLCKRCHFVTNPTKLNYLSQEIVVMRDDFNARLKRNSIQFTSDDHGRPDEEETNLKIDAVVRDTPIPTKILEARKLVKTLLDQSHLSPFDTTKRPIVWDRDYFLTMAPLPSMIILNDASINEFDVTYEGCHVINPGLFMTRNQVNYVEYWPSTKKAEFKHV